MLATPDILETLIGFRTVSRDANEAMIRWIAAALTGAGGDVRVLPGNAPARYNLFASFGPPGDGGIVLSGHSDVVPVDGQDWATDPFALTARAGALRGRGAVDMKGFIASAIAAAGRIDVNRLQRPLHIAISHDEETGCIGVRRMLATLAAEKFRAAGCIVGEPTGLRIAVGHKGKIAGCIQCRGVAAHSANPSLGCNAIHLAADMVAALRALQDFLRAHGARDAAYAVPYSTVHVGTIAGGAALNIVPDSCDIGFEIRLLPGDAPAPLLARLRAAAARIAAAQAPHAASIKVIEQNAYPGLDSGADTALVALLQAAGAGEVLKVGFGSEAGLFKTTLALPAIVCGPGSIDRAHKPDEFITSDELTECDAFLDRVIATLNR